MLVAGLSMAGVWMALVLGTSSSAVAQNGVNQRPQPQTVSTKEQVVRGLQALRAIDAAPVIDAACRPARTLP